MENLIEKLADCPQIAAHRHDLPFPGIPSRISTAICLSLDDLQINVIKKMLVLCKRGRVFIITQNGLSGFLLKCHNNCLSWISDYLRTELEGVDDKEKLAGVQSVYLKL